MRDAIVARVVQRMAEDDSIVFLTGDLGFGVLDELFERFAGRTVNVGVSEQNMLSLAAGLALEGYRPFIYSIANFPTIRALEQLRNDICYHRLPVRIISVGGGLGYGPLGPSHHASDDLGALLALPGLAVFTPSTTSQVQVLTDAAFEWPGPVYLRIDRGKPLDIDHGGNVGPGSVSTVRRGSHLTVFSYGSVLREALAAAEEVSASGIDVQVEACGTLRPLDVTSLLAAAERGPVLIVEEHGRVGGLATSFAQTCLEGGISPIAYAALTLGDDFVREVGSTDWLRSVRGVDRSAIAASIQHLVLAATEPKR